MQVEKLEQLASLPRLKPKNGIEYYYEVIVTGRAYKENLSELDELKTRIAHAKAACGN
jgi:hypothetical protein